MSINLVKNAMRTQKEIVWKAHLCELNYDIKLCLFKKKSQTCVSIRQ